MTKLAILASGNGTNADAIMRYFAHHSHIKVEMILSNNPDAYVLKRAAKNHIEHRIFTREEFKNSTVCHWLKGSGIDFIVLAGFLWLLPARFIQAFPDRIINIHPALLPAYGGKGMYGERIHSAVKNAGEKETGISIHLVNEKYDEGQIIFQKTCPVYPEDSAEEIAARIHELEYEYYPKVIESVIKNL